MSEYLLVHETGTSSLIGSIDRPTQRPRVNRQIARAQYDNEKALGNTSIPSINQLPDNQMLNIGGGNFLYDFRGVASVKTFERVEGATITGQANATDSNVLASVRLRTTNTDREFDYFRETETDENGRFEVTVPYATEGDVSVEEGGTNSTVEARGPYSVFVGENVSKVEAFGQVGVTGTEEEGRINVTETDVYMGNEVEIELEEAGSGDAGDGGGNEGTGTEGDGTEDGVSEEDGTESSGDQTQDDTSGDGGTGDGTSGGEGAAEDGSNSTDGGSPGG
jgi:dolichyl-diphosphooligosaccharide--protein glycosyltransferase